MTHTINVALIGQRFMGRAHANAYRQVRAFFDPALVPRLRLACGRNAETLTDFAHRFGWEEHTTDWHNAVTRDDIDLVDICVSNDLHAEIAIQAAQAGARRSSARSRSDATLRRRDGCSPRSRRQKSPT